MCLSIHLLVMLFPGIRQTVWFPQGVCTLRFPLPPPIPPQVRSSRHLPPRLLPPLVCLALGLCPQGLFAMAWPPTGLGHFWGPHPLETSPGNTHHACSKPGFLPSGFQCPGLSQACWLPGAWPPMLATPGALPPGFCRV
jgi:hypothetical protein